MVLLMVRIIFRRLFSSFMKRKSCCENPALYKKKKRRLVHTPEISATLWMGTSFLLCSPFPFLMALQVKRKSSGHDRPQRTSDRLQHACWARNGDTRAIKALGRGMEIWTSFLHQLPLRLNWRIHPQHTHTGNL